MGLGSLRVTLGPWQGSPAGGQGKGESLGEKKVSSVPGGQFQRTQWRRKVEGRVGGWRSLQRLGGQSASSQMAAAAFLLSHVPPEHAAPRQQEESTSSPLDLKQAFDWTLQVQQE